MRSQLLPPASLFSFFCSHHGREEWAFAYTRPLVFCFNSGILTIGRVFFEFRSQLLLLDSSSLVLFPPMSEVWWFCV